MSAITYDRTPAATPKRPGRWVRLYARIIEAPRRTAMEELRRHGLKLPQELEEAGWKINERSEDSLPFVR